MLDFHPKNPFRVVNWRWERAGNVLSGGPPLSRTRDDAWTARALRFRRAYNDCSCEEDFRLLAERDPAVYWAYHTYQGRDADAMGPGMVLVAGLEARILATQAYADIAPRVQLDVDAIDAYERLFFNVAGKHDALDYIGAMVFGPAVYRGVRTRAFDVVWKLYGWGFGPMYVDMFLAHHAARAKPTDAAGLAASIVDALKESWKVKGMVAAAFTDVNQFNAVAIVDSVNAMLASDGKGGAAGAQESVFANINEMMVKLPFRVGANVVPEAVEGRKLAVARLDEYDAGAAELRGDELMALAVGGEVPEPVHLNLLAFPAPPAHAALPAPATVEQ